jgi:hypothetical protein
MEEVKKGWHRALLKDLTKGAGLHSRRVTHLRDNKNPPAGEKRGEKEGSAVGEAFFGGKLRNIDGFLTIIGLTSNPGYVTIELPLIGCPPQPVRGIFYNVKPRPSPLPPSLREGGESSEIWDLTAIRAVKSQISLS